MTILIVGGGKMGLSHLALVTQYVGKQNVAIVERKRSVRMIFKIGGYRTFDSVEAAVAKGGKPDGLVIATQTSSHAALADWAIENDVTFFVEKPLTLDPSRSAGLVEAAAASCVSAQMGFVLRYSASFQRLRALVDEQRLGRVLRYEASMRGNVITAPQKADNWQGDFARGGGCLNEYGPHIIDLCRFIFGEVEEINAAEKGHVHSTNADDWIELNWTHAEGIPGALRIDWCDTTKRKSVIEFRVYFETAEVRADNSIVDIHWLDTAELDNVTRAEIEVMPRPANVGFYLRGEEFSLEMEDFVGKCLGKSFHVEPTLPLGITPGLRDGYEVDRLIEEIALKVGMK